MQSIPHSERPEDVLIERFYAVRQARPNHPATVQLTGVYHNLLRQWTEL